jgi:4-aminobutyrate aminotransferase/(S)-3-amino-2-methylpropionate transaminase
MSSGANAALLARRQAAVARGVSQATPIAFARALNAEIWDLDGVRYVDFASGIAVVNTGHRHPRVVAAVEAEMKRFTHPCFQVGLYESYVALAERLNAIAPVAAPVKTVLFSTGAEATENAVKIARAATGREGIIAFTGGFHGRTALALGMTGTMVPYKKDLGPMPPGIWHVPFPATSTGVTLEEALRRLDQIFQADIDPSRVAAIIIEPVQGEGGFHQAPPDFMAVLRRVTDEHGIVLIADEVQTGFGRTGKVFAMEHYDVRPDLISVGKSIAGGMPLSGVIGHAAIMDAAGPGALGGTYGGNPLACAAALAVLDVLEEERLPERANTIGVRLKERLRSMERRNDLMPIASIRGPGAMIAFDIVRERGSLEPVQGAAKQVTARAAEKGLIVLPCGALGATVRILVPLTAPDAIVEEGLDRLEQALAVVN